MADIGRIRAYVSAEKDRAKKVLEDDYGKGEPAILTLEICGELVWCFIGCRTGKHPQGYGVGGYLDPNRFGCRSTRELYETLKKEAGL